MRRPQRRRYRVGAPTVNFTSIGLVASAIMVVLEVTAPSSAPPAFFASPVHAARPGPSALPNRFAAPAVSEDPVSQRVLGAPTSAPSATGAVPAVTTAVVSPPVSLAAPIEVPTTAAPAAVVSPPVSLAAPIEVPTTVAPAAVQHPGATVSALGGLDQGAGNGSGHGPGIEKGGFAAVGASPNNPVAAVHPGGNGVAGNGAGANGHGDGVSLKGGPIEPAAPAPAVPSVPVSVVAPPGRGPATGFQAPSPVSSVFGDRPPATGGFRGGEGQDEFPAAAPGRASPHHQR